MGDALKRFSNELSFQICRVTKSKSNVYKTKYKNKHTTESKMKFHVLTSVWCIPLDAPLGPRQSGLPHSSPPHTSNIPYSKWILARFGLLLGSCCRARAVGNSGHSERNISHMYLILKGKSFSVSLPSFILRLQDVIFKPMTARIVLETFSSVILRYCSYNCFVWPPVCLFHTFTFLWFYTTKNRG